MKGFFKSEEAFYALVAVTAILVITTIAIVIILGLNCTCF